MKTVTFDIPPTMLTMNACELERALLSSIATPIKAKELVPALEERYPTRRAANSVAKRIEDRDLIKFHESLAGAKEMIDFDKQYIVIAKPHNRQITLQQ